MNAFTKTPVKDVELGAYITRADGSIERLGRIAYYSSNPFKRLLAKLKDPKLGKVKWA